MKFGPQRGHFLYIFERFFATFGLLILMILFFLITGEWQMLMNYIALPIIAVIGPLAKILDFLFTYYSISDESLFIKKGLLKKKNTEIPLSTITNVDYSQGLILQLAHAYTITVDTTATISADNLSKIRLTLKEEDAEKVKGLLLAHKYKSSEEEQTDAGLSAEEEHIGTSIPVVEKNAEDKILSVTHASIKEIFLMGLMESKLVVIGQIFSVLAVIITFGSMLIMGQEVDGEEFLINQLLQLSGAALISGFVILLLILGFVGGVAKAMLKYFNFRITNRTDSIFIEYGLITKKTHTLRKEKISGVQFRQPFLMRLFNCGVVNVFAVGYGDNPQENDNAAVLFPFLKTSQLDNFVAHHFPGLTVHGETQRPTKNALRFFFITPRFFVGICILIAGVVINILPLMEPDVVWIFIIPGSLLCVLVFFAILISILLEYKNTAISSSSDGTILISGGYTRNRTLLYTHMIESLTGSGSVFKRRKGIVTITLGLWGSKSNASHKVRNLEETALNDLRSHIIY